MTFFILFYFILSCYHDIIKVALNLCCMVPIMCFFFSDNFFFTPFKYYVKVKNYEGCNKHKIRDKMTVAFIIISLVKLLYYALCVCG